jgi:hypothetical protein
MTQFMPFVKRKQKTAQKPATTGISALRVARRTCAPARLQVHELIKTRTKTKQNKKQKKQKKQVSTKKTKKRQSQPKKQVS